MPAKRILLWNPYLDTCGGGEKHMFQIVQSYLDRGYELTIAWDRDISKDLYRKLQIALPPKTRWIPKLYTYSLIQKLALLRAFDTLLYATDGSYFFSTAQSTICFCMVPSPKLYQMNWLNRLKTRGWHWIVNSEFTKRHLIKCKINAHVVYPVIEIPHNRLPDSQYIKGHILTFITVGRFFRHLHSKRHDVAITWFSQFIQKNPEFSASKLVLIGGLKPEDKKYFESLKNMASFYPNIVFRPNISHHDLAHIYRSGDFYLHFAGWGIDGSAHPERTEHLGITPMEAMSYGCIPLCYENGGIPEVIDTGINGYTFKTLDELTTQVKRLCTDTVLQESFRKAGTEKIHRVFSKSALNIALQKL